MSGNRKVRPKKEDPFVSLLQLQQQPFSDKRSGGSVQALVFPGLLPLSQDDQRLLSNAGLLDVCMTLKNEHWTKDGQSKDCLEQMAHRVKTAVDDKVARFKGMHDSIMLGIVVPFAAVDTIRELDEERLGVRWHIKKSIGDHSRIFQCRGVGNAGKCRMTVRLFEDSRHHLALLGLIAHHDHLPEANARYWKCTSIHPSLRQVIIDMGKAGQDSAHIFQNITCSVLELCKEFVEFGVPIPPTWVVTEQVVRNILYRESISPRFTRLDKRDMVDVQRLADVDNRVKVISSGSWSDSQKAYSEHVQIYVGSNEQYQYRQYAAGKLVVLDATHSTTRYGFYVYTMLGLDGNADARIIGHLITSDRQHSAIERWLRWIKSDSSPPAEVLIDKDNTERAALELSGFIDKDRVKLCWFHVLKAIRTQTSGLNQKLKNLITSMMTVVHLSETPEELALNLDKAKTAFQALPESTAKYLRKNWLNEHSSWVLLHRVFKHIRTTNHVESYHRLLKFSASGAKGEIIRRVGDCVRVLLSTDSDRIARSFTALLRGGTPSACANRIFIEQKDKAMTLLQSPKPPCITFSDVGNGQGAIVYDDAEEGKGKMYTFDLMAKECSCEWSQTHSLGRCCKHLLAVAIVLEDSTKHNLVESDGSVDKCVPPEWDSLNMKHLSWTESLRRDTEGLLERMVALSKLIGSPDCGHSFTRIPISTEDKTSLMLVLQTRAQALGKNVTLPAPLPENEPTASTHAPDLCNEAPQEASAHGVGSTPSSQPHRNVFRAYHGAIDQENGSFTVLQKKVLETLPTDVLQRYIHQREKQQINGTRCQGRWLGNISDRYGRKVLAGRNTHLPRTQMVSKAYPSFYSIVQAKTTRGEQKLNSENTVVLIRGSSNEETTQMFNNNVRARADGDMSAAQRRRKDNETHCQSSLDPPLKRARTALSNSDVPAGWREGQCALPNPKLRI